MNWKTIDTIPRDGKNYLVWGRNFDFPEVVRYETYEPELAEEQGETVYWRYADTFIADVADVDLAHYTHWAEMSPPQQ